MTPRRRNARLTLIALASAAALFSFWDPAHAADVAAEAEHVSARLYAAKQEGQVVHGGLAFTLAPEWHSYWRNPGDSGLPPVLDWTGSANIEGLKVLWPVPQRFEDFGLHTFGFEDAFTLPLEIRKGAEGPATLDLKATVMVCRQICVPQELGLRLDIPADLSPGPALVAEHEEALERLPVAADLPALKIETAVAGPEAFVVTVFAQHGMDDMDLFVEADGVALNQPPEIAVQSGDMRRAILRIPAPPDVDNLSAELRGKAVRVTLVNRGRAVEKQLEF